MSDEATGARRLVGDRPVEQGRERGRVGGTLIITTEDH